MSRSHPQVNFRIPPELKEKLETAAKKNHRTITAELVARLENSFMVEGRSATEDSVLIGSSSVSRDVIEQIIKSTAEILSKKNPL